MPRLEAIINVQMLFTTVLQMLNQGSTRNRAVIDFGAPFLVLFWRSKKGQSSFLNDYWSLK